MEQRYNDDDGEKYIRNDDNEMAVTHDTKKWTGDMICWNQLGWKCDPHKALESVHIFEPLSWFENVMAGHKDLEDNGNDNEQQTIF